MAQKANLFPRYRVVVKALAEARGREFTWEIVQGQGGSGAKTVAKSISTFKTMEEAYISGAAALERINRAGVSPV